MTDQRNHSRHFFCIIMLVKLQPGLELKIGLKNTMLHQATTSWFAFFYVGVTFMFAVC
jgi:hypothetical protein